MDIYIYIYIEILESVNIFSYFILKISRIFLLKRISNIKYKLCPSDYI